MEIEAYSTIDDTEQLENLSFISQSAQGENTVSLPLPFKLDQVAIVEIFGGLPKLTPPSAFPDELYVLALSKDRILVAWFIQYVPEPEKPINGCTFAPGWINNEPDMVIDIITRYVTERGFDQSACSAEIMKELIREKIDIENIAARRQKLLRANNLDDETIERRRREISTATSIRFRSEVMAQKNTLLANTSNMFKRFRTYLKK